MDESPATAEEEAIVDELLNGMRGLVEAVLSRVERKEAAVWRLEQVLFARRGVTADREDSKLLNAAVVLLSVASSQIATSD